MGANYLKDKVNGMGNKRLALNRRIVGRKAPTNKRGFGGGSLGRSYYDENGNYTVGFGCGGALYPSGYGGALYPA